MVKAVASAYVSINLRYVSIQCIQVIEIMASKFKDRILNPMPKLAADSIWKYWREIWTTIAIFGAVTLHSAFFIMPIPKSFSPLIDFYLFLNITFVFVVYLSLALFFARIFLPIVYLIGWAIASVTHQKYISESYIRKPGWSHDKGEVIDRSMGMHIRLAIKSGIEFIRAIQVGIFIVVLSEFYTGYRFLIWFFIFAFLLSFFLTAAFPRLIPKIEFTDDEIERTDWSKLREKFFKFLLNDENRNQFMSFTVVVVLCFAAFLGYARYQYLISVTPIKIISIKSPLSATVLTSNRSGWIAYVPNDGRHIFISHEGDIIFEAIKITGEVSEH